MTLMIWSSDYKVDVDSLDADHITIFSLINHIDEAHHAGTDKQAISELLKVLIDRAMAHFKREEMIMKQNEYPDFNEHVAEHREIIKNIEELYEAYLESTSHTLSRAIIRILCSWLADHILKSDMRYKPYVSK